MERARLLDNLKMNLQNMTLTEFVHLFTNEIQAIEDFFKLCNGVKEGNTISLLFNPHRLTTTTVTDNIGIYGSLKHDDKLDGLARLYLYNMEIGISKPFYIAVQRGYNSIQWVNEFPPYVARELYLKYHKEDTPLKVLDPCAGWGGRMIGCASISNSTYIGFEPSTETYKGLLKLGEWLKSLQPSFNYIVYNMPYEDSNLTDKFDIAFTSPPYFNTENYSDEDTNSLNRFNTFEKWIDGFYKPLILNTVNRLTDKGAFILNVGDRKYPLSDAMLKICKEHNLCCEREHDYLMGKGDLKEKFYVISKQCVRTKPICLF